MISQRAQNIGDMIIIPTGAGIFLHELFLEVGLFVNNFINPILISISIITTIIWTLYRIREMRNKDKERKENKGDENK